MMITHIIWRHTMKIRYTSFASIIAAMLLVLSPVMAGENMSADQIKALIAGKSMHAEHMIKDFEFDLYFDADGETAHRSQGGDTTKTTYKFKGDKHCIFWKGANRCAFIRDNGDGTYSRVNGRDKEIIKWSNIVDGNKL